jgi:hypothetical protein
MDTSTYTSETGTEMVVHWDDLEYQLLERIDCYDQTYECRGHDANGNIYSGIASISCGDCVDIEDIELL